MSEAVPSNVVAPITLIAEWDGPAVNHPALAGRRDLRLVSITRTSG